MTWIALSPRKENSLPTDSYLVERVKELERENSLMKRAGLAAVHKSCGGIARLSEELFELVEGLDNFRLEYLESAEILAEIETEERADEVEDLAIELEDLADSLKDCACRMAARW